VRASVERLAAERNLPPSPSKPWKFKSPSRLLPSIFIYSHQIPSFSRPAQPSSPASFHYHHHPRPASSLSRAVPSIPLLQHPEIAHRSPLTTALPAPLAPNQPLQLPEMSERQYSRYTDIPLRKLGITPSISRILSPLLAHRFLSVINMR
jgi:hypothetical protein